MIIDQSIALGNIHYTVEYYGLVSGTESKYD